jgi:folate-binding protein YgfZ
MSERWIAALTDRGARFADGRVADYGDAASELAAADGTIICDLSHDGLIQVGGTDAAAYLQAQFCNDVAALVEDGAQWNGWCSPKGRMLATFLVWRSADGYLLQLPRALQAAIQKRMQMFVLRSKVTLTDVSAQWIRFGVAGARAAGLIEKMVGTLPAQSMSTSIFDDGMIVRISANRFEVVARDAVALNWWQELSRNATPAGASVWDGFGVSAGILTVLPETQDAFVPQMANFELIGGVSFKKGCYPGQEIVARTQYRGILKRRMGLVHGEGAVMPMPGASVYSPVFGDQAAGVVANVSPALGGGFDALVVAQIEALKGGTLTLGSLDGENLGTRLLPYVVPELVRENADSTS